MLTSTQVQQLRVLHALKNVLAARKTVSRHGDIGAHSVQIELCEEERDIDSALGNYQVSYNSSAVLGLPPRVLVPLLRHVHPFLALAQGGSPSPVPANMRSLEPPEKHISRPLLGFQK